MPAQTTTEEELAKGAQAAAREGAVKTAKAQHADGLPGTYTVQPGDSLASIAEAVYGSKGQADAIFAASSATIGSDPRALQPGQVLALPALTGAAADTGPSESWTRAKLDEYARELGLDPSTAGNKADVLAMIETHTKGES